MNEEPPEVEPQKGCSWITIVVASVSAFGFLSSLFLPTTHRIGENARMMQASSNARQILITLRNYAEDHGGHYPDEVPGVKTSNDAFRVLIKAGMLEDERAFTAFSSPYEGDNNIGESPDFNEALRSGENHWSFVAGMRMDKDTTKPLIFENSANTDHWPPKWNCDRAGTKTEGRAWKSGRIVIGFNDGSTTSKPLESVEGDAVELKDKTLFPEQHDGLRILDVAR